MYIDTVNLPAQLKPLAGAFKTIRVESAQAVTQHADDGTWSGGTRRILSAVELASGRAVPITDTFSAPWSPDRRSREVALKPGFALMSGGHFCGKLASPTLYVHPQDLAPLLPAPAAPLSSDENVWLYCTCTLKAFARRDEAGRYGLTGAQIMDARQSLFAKGYLSANGAATTAGRNACPASLPSRW